MRIKQNRGSVIDLDNKVKRLVSGSTRCSTTELQPPCLSIVLDFYPNFQLSYHAMVEAALLKEIKDSVRMFVSGGVVDQAGNRSADRVFPLHIFREWEQRPFALHYAETLRKYGVYPARDPVSMRVTYTPKGVIALSIETTPPNERIPLKWQYFCGFTETTGDGSISARELLITRGQNGAQDTTQEIDRQTKASTDAEIQLFARFLKKSHHPKAI